MNKTPSNKQSKQSPQHSTRSASTHIHPAVVAAVFCLVCVASLIAAASLGWPIHLLGISQAALSQAAQSQAAGGQAAESQVDPGSEVARAPSLDDQPVFHPTIIIITTNTATIAVTPSPVPTKVPTPEATAEPTSQPDPTLSAAADATAVPTLSEPVLCTSPMGQLVTDTINSNVLQTSLPVQVYLPPCYDADHYSYPVVYLIQGSGKAMGQWLDDGIQRIADLKMSLGILPPFIIVMPASDLDSANSLYINSTGGKGSYEDYIVNELMPMIDAKYSTWGNREGTAIGGISRGGYWSLEIAFTNLDKFSVVGAHSPAIAPDYLIGTPSNFSMLSYAKPIDALKTIRIFVDAGNNDFTLDGVNQFTSELDAAHIPYTKSLGDGTHDDTYWSSMVDTYLTFYSASWPHQTLAKTAVSKQ